MQLIKSILVYIWLCVARDWLLFDKFYQQKAWSGSLHAPILASGKEKKTIGLIPVTSRKTNDYRTGQRLAFDEVAKINVLRQEIVALRVLCRAKAFGKAPCSVNTVFALATFVFVDGIFDGRFRHGFANKHVAKRQQFPLPKMKCLVALVGKVKLPAACIVRHVRLVRMGCGAYPQPKRKDKKLVHITEC